MSIDRNDETLGLGVRVRVSLLNRPETGQLTLRLCVSRWASAGSDLFPPGPLGSAAQSILEQNTREKYF